MLNAIFYVLVEGVRWRSLPGNFPPWQTVYIRQWRKDGTWVQMHDRLNLFTRQGGAITNFERTLPGLDSDLAHQLIKDPYNFDFLTITEDAKERELEKALVVRIREFLLDLFKNKKNRQVNLFPASGGWILDILNP